MRLAVTIGSVAAVAAIGWAGIAGLEPCGWLNRMLGLSGCVGSWEVSDLTAPRRTVAFRPGAPSTLVIAGVTRLERYGYGGVGQPRIVLLDTQSGEVTARYDVEPGGLIEQLALSPDGRLAALTCNRQRGCDFAPADVPDGIDGNDFMPVGLADLDEAADDRSDGVLAAPRGATRWWIRGFSRRELPLNADGTSADLRFSVDGTIVTAGPHAWTVEGGAEAAAPADLAPKTEGFDRVATAEGDVVVDRARQAVELGRVGRIPLDLPDGFVLEAHVPVAVSPDGGSVALLARRFAGPGEVRAVLFAWRLADGAPLLREEIGDDLYAPLVWSPDGTRLIVAVAAPPAMRARLEIRAYATGVSS